MSRTANSRLSWTVVIYDSSMFGKVLSYDAQILSPEDGKSIYLEDAPERIIDLLKDARQPMFLVCVTDQARRLATAAQRKPPKSEALSPARRSRIG